MKRNESLDNTLCFNRQQPSYIRAFQTRRGMEQKKICKNRYVLCRKPVMLSLWLSECRYKRFVSEEVDMPEMWSRT